jgi:hypothetical protein
MPATRRTRWQPKARQARFRLVGEWIKLAEASLAKGRRLYLFVLAYSENRRSWLSYVTSWRRMQGR